MLVSILKPIFHSIKNNTMEFFNRRIKLEITLVSKVSSLYEQNTNLCLDINPILQVAMFNPIFATLGPS